MKPKRIINVHTHGHKHQDIFQKLCFATDNPEPPRWIELSQRLMDELALPADLQEQFWWKNGARWLGLGTAC